MKVLKSISSLGILIFLIIGLSKSGKAQEGTYAFAKASTFAAQNVQEEPYKSEFFRVRGTPKVTVHTTTGNIEVFQNSEIDGIKVDLYLERSFSLWSGRRSLENFRIILQQQGDHIIASVENKSTGYASNSDDIRFNFVVQTPEKVSTILRTFNGDIFLENVDGDHFLQNQSGDLNVKGARGEIKVASTLGNINLEDLSGTTFAKTVSGNVRAISCSGETRIQSVSGNIEAAEITGALVSATTSGFIFADFEDESKGRIYLKSISGDIELLLPSTNGYEIEGDAVSYDLDGLNQSTLSNKSQNHRNLNVVIREGGVPVKLSTMSGQIRIAESQ